MGTKPPTLVAAVQRNRAIHLWTL